MTSEPSVRIRKFKSVSSLMTRVRFIKEMLPPKPKGTPEYQSRPYRHVEELIAICRTVFRLMEKKTDKLSADNKRLRTELDNASRRAEARGEANRTLRKSLREAAKSVSNASATAAHKEGFLELVKANPDKTISELAELQGVNYRTAWGWANLAGLLQGRKHTWNHGDNEPSAPRF